MVELKDYSKCVEEIIKYYGQFKPSYGEVEVQTVFDRVNHHYHLINVGWHDSRRIRGCVLHIDIKNNKIWIQHDGTETGVANELVEMGVPKEDIVLAFHAPYKRPFTGFGVN